MKQFVNDAFAQDPRILQRRAEEKALRFVTGSVLSLSMQHILWASLRMVPVV